jgi:hypothetical protein
MPYYQSESATLYHDNCLTVMRTLADCSIDSIVTDPPAGISFMGKDWDHHKGGRDAWVAWLTEVMRECLRVLKPGGHALVWALPRTSHWTAWAIEGAGFQIRDRVSHLFGSGFPKSLDVSKAIDSAAGAERRVVGVYMPPDGHVRSVLRSSTVAMGKPNDQAWNTPLTAPVTAAAKQWNGWGTALKPACEDWWLCRKPLGTPELNVRQVVENAIIKSGLITQITWSKPVSRAEQPAIASSSTQTEPPTMVEISVNPASVNAMQDTETVIENSLEKTVANGTTSTESEHQNSKGDTASNLSEKSLTLMVESVSAAKNQRSFSSPSIILTAEEPPIEGEHLRFITSLKDLGFLLDTALFAGTAIGDSVSGHVLIKQNSDGSLEWPSELPLMVPARSLTVAQNILKHGTGGLNIDGCRIEGNKEGDPSRFAGYEKFSGRQYAGDPYSLSMQNGLVDTSKGRWPANVTTDGSDEVLAGFPDEAGGGYGKRGGERQSDYGFGGTMQQVGFGDSGSAARFFYCAKSSQQDRNEGLEDLELLSAGTVTDRQDGSAGLNSPRAGAGRNSGSRNHHPTVKPLALMRYLVRLITPPNGLVLDPFCGSGSTGKATVFEDFRFIGIELNEDYCQLARRRIEDAIQQNQFKQPGLFPRESYEGQRLIESEPAQPGLFATVAGE